MPNFVFFTPPLLKGVWRYTLITHHMGLTQIDLIIQILLFPLRFPREPLSHAADATVGAENLRNPINLCGPIIHMRRAYCNNALITHDMGLSQIDLIKQIYYFLLRFPRFLRETPLPLAYGADAADGT